MVAEIINGKRETDTFDFLLHLNSGTSIPLVGVWRLWFEHPGSENQVQERRCLSPQILTLTTFLSFIRCQSLAASTVLIHSSQLQIRLKSFVVTRLTRRLALTNNGRNDYKDEQRIMITSNKAAYNYAEFEMRLTGNPKEVSDGYIVLANVFNAGASDEEDPLTEQPRRMIFVKGSPPANKIATMSKGDTLHVLGIPRVNLNEVYAIANGMQGHDEYAFGGLPYEMIIVAVLKDAD